MDSDDDLNLPPPKKTINLDSDDDLPPPPPRAAAPAIALDDDDDDLDVPPKPPAKQNKADKQADEQIQQSPLDTKTKMNPMRVYKEGFLFKQQPSWPYSNQKRYCVIKNCKFFYFDSKESMNDGRPQGVIQLSNAKLANTENEAKLPSSFGIRVQQEKDQEAAGKKERTFIFAVMHAHELSEWKTALHAVVGDLDEEAKQVHWFEKMTQGIY